MNGKSSTLYSSRYRTSVTLGIGLLLVITLLLQASVTHTGSRHYFYPMTDLPAFVDKAEYDQDSDAVIAASLESSSPDLSHPQRQNPTTAEDTQLHYYWSQGPPRQPGTGRNLTGAAWSPNPNRPVVALRAAAVSNHLLKG